MMKIIFAGSSDFALPHLNALIELCHLSSRYELSAVYTQPDRPSGRGQKIQETPIKLLAKQYNLHIKQPSNFKCLAARETLRLLQPDLIVVVAYGLILPEVILKIPRLGCINVHASLLPQWRGAAPIQRALLAGDTQTGITIIQMNSGVDTGDILYQKKLSIISTDTTDSLQKRLEILGATCLVTTLTHFERLQKSAQPQLTSGTSYATKIQKSHALINWNNDAVTIERQIRAFYPWPIATTQLHGKLIRIWKAFLCTPVHSTRYLPGQIIAMTLQSITVSTANGFIELTQLQLEGKKPLPIFQLVNGQLSFLTVGMQFKSFNT